MRLKPRFLLVLAGSFWLAQAVLAADRFPPLLYAAEGAQKILRYDSEGQVVWEYPAEMARDVWALPNQNVLFCFNRDYNSAKHDNPSGVLEVTPDKKVVFAFWTTGQVWSCQRLADGNTLVGAASQGKLLIVNPQAKVNKSISVLNPPGHSCMRNARQIAGGHFLVAEESAHAVREYDTDGKLVREIKLSFAPFSVVRLENSNTVICGQQTLVEVDPAGKILRSVDGKDLPDLGIRWFAGLQVLPNGNFFVCNAGGKVPFLELAPDKRVLWQSPSTLPVPLG
ncbi:MAG TPA: hypothetical protein VNT26_23885, partial [Candidatus Sulfotelmatobacter sp.]|nr:hypothetical protein [Candidatus Sulfotelmatobacter sp.]